MTDGKLVRDLIPDLIRHSGRTVDVRYLTGEQLLAALGAKLIEEASEAAEVVHRREDLIEELADVYAVLAALKDATGITDQEVVAAAERKRQERGGFSSGVWLFGTRFE